MDGADGAQVAHSHTWYTGTAGHLAAQLYGIPHILTAHSLEPLLDLWETLPGGELNFPPDYPKMPGEPPRVQPSKKREDHWDAEGNRIEK